MTPRADEYEEDNLSSTDDDEDDVALKEDMAALSRACMLVSGSATAGDGVTARSKNDHHELVLHDDDDDDDDSGGILLEDPLLESGDAIVPLKNVDSDSDDDDDEDDLECLRRVESLYQPLASLPPLSPLRITMTNASGNNVDDEDEDDDEDDLETLRAIRSRFSSYNEGDMETLVDGDQTSCLGHEGETANGSVSDRWDVGELCAVSPIQDNATDSFPSNVEVEHCGLIDSCEQDACRLSKLPQKRSSFPSSAQAFIDAINKNRSMQRFLRSKLIEIEAKIEENKQLRNKVKVMKDFQAACIRKTGSALSLKKDPRVQLISAKKPSAPKNSKSRNKKISAMCYGPAENSHVSNYKMVLERFPLSLDRKKWTNSERENLKKGIKQQFQETVLQNSADRISSEFSDGYGNDMDSIIASVNDLEITPEDIKKFIPQVNWDKLASTYDVGHTGAECESRWLNYEDPLINHDPWTGEEDKSLLLTVQIMGIRNWSGIAVSLATNRTPFQCLARYQRSLNASMLNSEWTEEEDAQLCSAVALYGEHDWQSVASVLERRTGTQCSNRWKKSLYPDKKGCFTREEDERLTVAVMLFGRKWSQVAKFVPGRIQSQCRDRYLNSLDPSLKWGGWTKEEDSRLKDAIAKHGFCWSKVAEDLLPRTDSQCRKRWRVLCPDQVPLLRDARKMQKLTVNSNFVDRESERPALTLKDFLPLPMLPLLSDEADDVKVPRKRKWKWSNVSNKMRSKRQARKAQVCLKDIAFSDGVKICDEDAVNMACLRKSNFFPTNDQGDLSRQDTSEKFLYFNPIWKWQGCTGQNKENWSCTLPCESPASMTIRGAEPSEHKQKTKMRKPGSLSACVESLDQDRDITLASLLNHKSKKNIASHPKVKKQNVMIDDDGGGDDVTLACLLANKSKKPNEAAKGRRACCSPSKLKKGSVLLPEVLCTNKPVITADDNELSLPELVEEQPVSSGAVAEPTNINVEGDDLLVNFLQNKRRKQRKRARIG
ncbi:PREDICTED: uncharacterized protein LOC109343055 isoform X2 [Lupinus angustifolius]|uniref:uncharacterized protein LOC109343054 isoform X2 n=1 Tax=Lupinus angustifolius TaxID=3871 RepID=UPI00092F7EC2|nr:PREDICTED: uncharacterized protein LOC109343054 isoform X2 [Lupinus angustifolius]XP_019436716.1 PREDICTED: uncharacterized protein LOC109343055 isoform X2 [Lupinus angustifolius]